MMLVAKVVMNDVGGCCLSLPYGATMLLCGYRAQAGGKAGLVVAPPVPETDPRDAACVAQGAPHPSSGTRDALRFWLGTMEWLHFPPGSVLLFEDPRGLPGLLAADSLQHTSAAILDVVRRTPSSP